MADRALFAGIPPGAIPIVRSGTVGTIYTVPANRRLHIVAGWTAVGQPNTTPAVGELQLRAQQVVSDPNVRVIVATPCGDNAGQASANAISGIDVPVPAGVIVDLQQNGLAGARLQGGFFGWEEPALPGLGSV